LANGGLKYKPKIVIATQDAVTRTKQAIPSVAPENLGFSPENVAIVRNAMVGVTKEGTSVRSFAGASYLSGGKTGTAQAVGIGKNEKYDARRIDEHQRDHALYIAFAPADDPKIALAIVVENAGFGSDSAAPITRRIFDYWLLNQYPSLEDMSSLQSGKGGAPLGKPRMAADVPLIPTAQAVADEIVNANALATKPAVAPSAASANKAVTSNRPQKTP
jgi:penicillin-binding protein 2